MCRNCRNRSRWWAQWITVPRVLIQRTFRLDVFDLWRWIWRKAANFAKFWYATTHGQWTRSVPLDAYPIFLADWTEIPRPQVRPFDLRPWAARFVGPMSSHHASRHLVSRHSPCLPSPVAMALRLGARDWSLWGLRSSLPRNHTNPKTSIGPWKWKKDGFLTIHCLLTFWSTRKHL